MSIRVVEAWTIEEASIAGQAGGNSEPSDMLSK